MQTHPAGDVNEVDEEVRISMQMEAILLTL
jgi:hypothetical protein